MPEREALTIDHVRSDGTVEQVRVLRWEVFRRWRRRATIAFGGVVLSSALGIALAAHAGSASDHALRREAKRAVTRSCEDRMDVRLAVAIGFDELRRLAVPAPRTPAMRVRYDEFILRTQAPIDDLLTTAGGETVKTVGPVKPSDIASVRSAGTARCRALGERFDENASAVD